jgi:hypothetical protein
MILPNSVAVITGVRSRRRRQVAVRRNSFGVVAALWNTGYLETGVAQDGEDEGVGDCMSSFMCREV